MGRSLLILLLLAGVTVWARRGLGDRAAMPAGRPDLRGWVWLAMGVGLQIIWVRVVSPWAAAPTALHWLPGLAVLCALRFVWLNAQYRGLWVLVAGAGLNLLVMASNGGLMPISSTNLHALGDPRHSGGTALALTKNRVLSDGAARLALLDDRLVFAVAGLHMACSVGDLLVATGCLLTLTEEVARGRHHGPDQRPGAAPRGQRLSTASSSYD